MGVRLSFLPVRIYPGSGHKPIMINVAENIGGCNFFIY